MGHSTYNKIQRHPVKLIYDIFDTHHGPPQLVVNILGEGGVGGGRGEWLVPYTCYTLLASKFFTFGMMATKTCLLIVEILN